MSQEMSVKVCILVQRNDLIEQKGIVIKIFQGLNAGADWLRIFGKFMPQNYEISQRMSVKQERYMKSAIC